MTVEPRRFAVVRTPQLVVAAALLCLCVAFGASSPALGAVPPPATRTTSVVAQLGGGAVGDLTFRTVFSDASATGVATPGALRLAIGNLYRIRTCVFAALSLDRGSTSRGRMDTVHAGD